MYSFFASSFFCSAQCLQDSFMLCIWVICSFLLLSSIPSHECIIILFSILLLVDILVIFSLVIVNKVVVNLPIQVFLWIYVLFLELISRSRIAESWGRVYLTVWKTSESLSQVVAPFYTLTSNVWEFQLCVLDNICVASLFNLSILLGVYRYSLWIYLHFLIHVHLIDFI